MSLGRDKRKLKFYVGGSDACQGNQIDKLPIFLFLSWEALVRSITINKSEYCHIIFDVLGDSGGPLYIWHDTRAYLVGVVSRGSGCALFNHPGIFTRVSKYTRWIQHNIKSGNCRSGKKRWHWILIVKLLSL